MSASVRVHSSVDNREVLARMCKELGWGEPTECRGFGSQLQVKLNAKGSDSLYGSNVLRFDLRTGEVIFDGDHRNLKLEAARVEDEYRVAEVILRAEEQGWDWERDINRENVTTVRVTVPDDTELVEEADYE